MGLVNSSIYRVSEPSCVDHSPFVSRPLSVPKQPIWMPGNVPVMWCRLGHGYG